ncbi:hypothetical protein [Muriicola sp. Z0-33]|uniref:hypothetical protein n=1 Tax=Muriicola sp. Z0-33 TaxID=2816957 RepID=UPI00223900AB|nr:hypothetical protein [Muriicola sp. Z0-33]MCW5515469.1 hypothetical protein [Muriicola sp. Z0-33]
MIKFFRRIRQKLLSENKFSKYLLYAIGEIFLVVIGILIALSINNWNVDRIQKNTVQDHLKSLAKAIEHDIREQNISMEFNEFRFHSWQYLLRKSGIPTDTLPDIPRPDTFIVKVWTKPHPDELDKEYIDTSMDQINNTFLGMFFNYSAINEINNLAILSDMNNDSLKVKINEYYYHLDWKFGEQSINYKYKFAEDLKNYLRDKHNISCSYPPEPKQIFDVIREDEKVVIMIKDLIKEVNKHYWDAREVQKMGRELLKMINKDLKKGK